MSTTESRAKTIQSVDRAAALIKAIADSPHSSTVNELATICGLNRSTTWRLLATLDAHGLIERDPISQRYSLGYAFLRIAAGADVDPLVRRGRPVLEELARETGETTNLATKMPEKTKELHDRMVAWRKEINAPMPTPNKGEQPPPAKKAKKAKAARPEKPLQAKTKQMQ